MKLNRIELKKIQYEFNSICNRLMQADFRDYSYTLKKFITYLQDTPIIYDYIMDCGAYNSELEDDIKKVTYSHGRLVFGLGETDSDEVCVVYTVLVYVVEHSIDVYYDLAESYSSSGKYQERVDDFNHRFVMILIRHIESFLTKVGIEMGLDERIVHNVTVQNGQLIIATDNANVSATNTVGVNDDMLNKLIEEVRSQVCALSDEDKETVGDCLEVIENEAKSPNPKKGMLKTALAGLKAIKGTAEFCAAVVGITQFVSRIVFGV